MMLRQALFALLAIMPLSVAQAAPEIGKPAPDFTAAAADGSSVPLSASKGKITVLEWNNPGCPFVRKHYESNNMQQLQAYAKEKGVVWYTVNSGAKGKEGYMDAAQAKEYMAKEHMASAHYLLDPEGKIGHLYGAKATPHMFVIDANGTLVYEGAIDSKASADKADIASAKNYVREAIDDLLAGKKIATPSTQAYGCSVKYGS